MNKAENALSAKAHALYAKRLRDEDYNAMLACRSNSELFAYLKSNTSYGEYMDTLPAVRLSRARFENTVKQVLLNRIASLCRFEKLIGEKLYKYFIIRNEIETIIYCSRHLDTDTITDLFIIPDFYKKEQTVFGEDMQKARSFSELAAFLEGTPYKKAIDTIVHRSANVGLAALENSLYNYLYSNAADAVKKGFRGKQREEILDYFRFLSDMTMIEALYRLNANYSQTDNYKANMFISSVSAFSDKEIKSLIDCTSADEIMRIVLSSPYKNYFSETDDRPIGQRIRAAEVRMSTKQLRFSQNPIVCMLCFSTVAENEVKNITHIIEGIKYNLSPDEISKIIVKGEC